MTDFTPGAIITRESPLWDGDRPSWLRDDVRVDVKWQLMWFSDLEKPFVHAESVYNWPGVTAIRLDASDIVYQCIAWNEAHPDEPVMWPWYGGDEAPADWDGGEVLFRDGSLVRSPSSWKHPWTKGFGDDKQTPNDIIGYQRRPTTSLPEPAEAKVTLTPALSGAFDDQGHPRDGNEFVPAYSAVATAKHYAELAAHFTGDLASEISRVAGCQKGSDRTRRLVEWVLDRDARLASGDAVREALEALLPTPLCGEAWGCPDSETVSITVTFGALRQARAALNHGGTQS